MELSLESDIYEPSIKDDGNYYDYLPSSNKFKNGLRCPCGARKEHIFDSRQSFSAHIKTKTHQKWLSDINLNKMNFFTECEKLKDVISSQKIIISQMEKELIYLKKEVNIKSKTIDILTEQLTNKDKIQEFDLLNFD
jgi:hypothetical protein